MVMQDHLLEAAKIIDVAQLQRVVHYSEWPIIPQWIRTALKLGAGSLLFWAALKWLFSRKMMAGFRRTMKFYGIGLPVAVRYRLKSMMVSQRLFVALMNISVRLPQDSTRRTRGRVCQDACIVCTTSEESDFGTWWCICESRSGIRPACVFGVDNFTGQVLSTRSDLLPKQWADELRDTLSNITPCPVQVKLIEPLN